MKWDALEGGTRVPAIVRWPAVVPAGRESDEIIAAIDILPTLAHACDIDLEVISNDRPKIDGVNVLETLIGKEDVEHPRMDLLYWHGSKGFHAIRVGDWKLFLNRKDAQMPDGSGEGTGAALFNLADESDEMTDVSADYPERVQEMKAQAERRLAEIKTQVIPLGE